MRDSDLKAAARQFSTTVIARELLVDVVGILRAADIDVMPLKGVLLHALVYPDAMDRPLRDVDVAVRSVDFERACQALTRSGYRIAREEGGRYEVALRTDRFPLSVDLHRAFAAARRFRLTPDAMFRRGRCDESLLGCSVVVPDDYDLYAHLLAHAALDFVGGAGWHQPEDLVAVGRSRGLDPRQCAQRLDEHGLGRLARLAIAPGMRLWRDSFNRQVASHLASDPVGAAIARVARQSYTPDPPPVLVRRIVGVLLNPSLGDSGRALIEAALARVYW